MSSSCMSSFINSLLKIFETIKILITLHFWITINIGIYYIYIKSTFLDGFKGENDLVIDKIGLH